MTKDTAPKTKKSKESIPEVKFTLREPNKKSGTPINAVFRYSGLKLVYSTKHKVHPKQWSKAKQLPRTTYDHYLLIKDDLNNIEAAIEEVYKENQYNKGNKLTLYKFKDQLDIKLGRKKIITDTSTPIGYLTKYIERREKLKDISDRAILKYKTLNEKLKLFAAYTSKVLEFDDINHSFLEDFTYYLYNKTNVKSQNTVKKYLASLKVILKAAKKDGLHDNDIARDEDFNISEVKTSIFALTEKEVKQFAEYDLSDNPRLERVRDWFIISCLSSLRFSDFSTITPDNIVDIDGDKFLHTWTKKTNQEVHIPITKQLLPILKKYDFTAPRISNQRFNDYIKEAAEVCGMTETIIINKNIKGNNISESVRKCDIISAHDGRRSFCTIGYKKGYPMLMLMACSGHQHESTFRRYIGIKQKDLAVALLKEMREKESQDLEGAKVVNL